MAMRLIVSTLFALQSSALLVVAASDAETEGIRRVSYADWHSKLRRDLGSKKKSSKGDSGKGKSKKCMFTGEVLYDMESYKIGPRGIFANVFLFLIWTAHHGHDDYSSHTYTEHYSGKGKGKGKGSDSCT